MRNIKILFILQLLVFIKVNSSLDIDGPSINKERQKCMEPFYQLSEDSEIDTDKCLAISSSLELAGKNKGKCCKINIDHDPLYTYQQRYGENWKKTIIKEFDLDENITEEEIRSKYLPSKKQSSCILTLDLVRDLSLYQYSFIDINREVKYDCGNGEEIFKAKDYHPTNEDEILEKDIMDCYLEFTEKNCNKRGMKVFSDKVSCCWCNRQSFYEDEAFDSIKWCRPFIISNMKEELQTELENTEIDNNRIEFKCDCYNKDGKIIKAGYNTVTGDVFIE